MLKLFPYRWQLHLFEEKNVTLGNGYEKVITKAKERKEIDLLRQEELVEYCQIDFEVDQFISRYLIVKAKSLIIPIPDFRGSKIWKYTNEKTRSRHLILTDKGISELRAAIRKEKRERREPYVIWISLVIGLIAATTGLLAVILK